MSANSQPAKPPLLQQARVIEAINGWAFVLPVTLGTLLLNLLPALPNLYYSVTEWNGLTLPQLIGVRNYVELFHDFDFLNSLRVTTIYAVGSIPLSMIAGLALALLVNRQIRGISLFRAIYYTPHISNIIAIVIVFEYLLAPRFGLINQTLWNLFQINGPNWLGTDVTAMASIIGVGIYTSAGYSMVLYLAGLQNIPDHLYEAAKIDGASRLARFLQITLPLLTPTIFFIGILSVIGSFSVFGLVFAMTGGGPGRATEVMFFLLYQEAFQQLRFGYASAIAVFMFVVVGLLTWLNWWLGKRWVFYG